MSSVNSQGFSLWTWVLSAIGGVITVLGGIIFGMQQHRIGRIEKNLDEIKKNQSTKKELEKTENNLLGRIQNRKKELKYVADKILEDNKEKYDDLKDHLYRIDGKLDSIQGDVSKEKERRAAFEAQTLEKILQLQKVARL